ncbi:Leucine-rich repeat [Dillenia turbinata]|uniref:Leucine-rich repeat n=1 Tax=Dillenia turbinata TaxID=194707 RepID=A0AAN8Z776_9MAGN
MSYRILSLHLGWWRVILSFSVLIVHSFGLNTDGILLLSLKYSILCDPLSVLSNWNYYDETPCSWNGVSCDPYYRVTNLSLPNSQLLGSIPADLGLIQFLQKLDLSHNSINGSLPISLLNSSQLQFLDLSNNFISGELSELIGGLRSLQFLNLSDNALAGNVPNNLTTLPSLNVVSLKNNYFSGYLPSGFNSVQVLDLSSNLINGSLPSDFGGQHLKSLNLSRNKISGKIPLEFADKIPSNATIDLSYNNLTGEIPDLQVFQIQDSKSFSGNSDLCGEPLRNPCPIPSSPANPPTNTSTSPPAIAAIPKPINSNPEQSSNSPMGSQKPNQRTLQPAVIAAIVIGDLIGIIIVGLIFLYVYQLKKKRRVSVTEISKPIDNFSTKEDFSSPNPSESKEITSGFLCLGKKKNREETEETPSSSSESENDEESKLRQAQKLKQNEEHKSGILVTVDGEKELELETLLKASAYILGATGSSIMYKAVLEDGSSLAVRRIGETGLERFRDFENQVRLITKLSHPNLVRIRGFYWGPDEKLVIYDFVPNGSLANARYRKVGSSPCHLPWEARLRIARGVARGLTYLHEKKHVHGNLKPSNILLGSDLEPKIGDFGLERLISGDTSCKVGGSTRNFGSKRSTASRDSFQDLANGATPSPCTSSMGSMSPYHAPESLRSLKPHPKWDVYSFGVILLELLTGKVTNSDDLDIGSMGFAPEEKSKILKLADMAIRVDLEGKEDALLACIKLGFNCISPIPQKRPTMKEALQVLEKFPSTPSYF